MDEYYDRYQLAKECGVSYWTTSQWSVKGRLPVHDKKVGTAQFWLKTNPKVITLIESYKAKNK